MNIHYFQRYHGKENVATANAMLLLSRLYANSPAKFYRFMQQILPDRGDIELNISMQEKIKDGTVPDAVISQASFKMVIETKLYNQFNLDQLVGHLESFGDEKYKVLLTLDPKPIDSQMADDIHKTITERGIPIFHKHLTFEDLISYVDEVIDDRDYEMQDILKDYRAYCSSGGLLPNDWKRMRVQLAGITRDYNIDHNIYYDKASHSFSGHKYLGLYNNKAVVAIGELKAIITAVLDHNELKIIDTIQGSATEDVKAEIRAAMEQSKEYGWAIGDEPHKYFIVHKFYNTNYVKTSMGGLMGTKFFDLCEVLGIKDNMPLPATEEIAALLRDKQWQ